MPTPLSYFSFPSLLGLMYFLLRLSDLDAAELERCIMYWKECIYTLFAMSGFWLQMVAAGEIDIMVTLVEQYPEIKLVIFSFIR
jgi:hypothetical protein